MSTYLWLALAGVAAGVSSTVAGLASLVSYPALLAAGLPPVTANVTNTTAMTGIALGAWRGHRVDLVGLGRRTARIALVCGVGGLIGATILLTTPSTAFEAVVPWLIGFGALLLLLKPRLRVWVDRRRAVAPAGRPGRRWPWALGLGAVGTYAGYFGAGAGVIGLALLSLRYPDPLVVSNAVKNLATGASNVAATMVYLAVGPVDWSAALPLAGGMLVGGWLGPQVARVLPEDRLRIGIACAGLALAVWLAVR